MDHARVAVGLGGALLQTPGRQVEVLFETVDNDGWRKGFTGSYLRVGVDPNAVNENDIATVNLFGCADGFVLGETTEQKAMTA